MKRPNRSGNVERLRSGTSRVRVLVDGERRTPGGSSCVVYGGQARRAMRELERLWKD